MLLQNNYYTFFLLPISAIYYCHFVNEKSTKKATTATHAYSHKTFLKSRLSNHTCIKPTNTYHMLVKKRATIVGDVGQNQSVILNSKMQKLIARTQIRSIFRFPSRVYAQTACIESKKVSKKIAPIVGGRNALIENVVFDKKKNVIREITNETILALLNRAIVLIVATVKIFSLKKTE